MKNMHLMLCYLSPEYGMDAVVWSS